MLVCFSKKNISFCIHFESIVHLASSNTASRLFPLLLIEFGKVSLVDRYQGYYLCSMGQTLLLLEQVWAGCSGSLTRLMYIIIYCSHNSTSQRSSDARGSSYLVRFIETRHLNNSGETGISWQYRDTAVGFIWVRCSLINSQFAINLVFFSVFAKDKIE